MRVVRHRFRRRGARRIRRQKDWIVGVQAFNQVLTETGGGGVAPLGEAIPLFALINGDDVRAHENKLTVLRIVGDFSYLSDGVRSEAGSFNGEFAPGLQAGIMVQKAAEDDSIVPPILGQGAGAATDLELGWMWLKSGPAGDTPWMNATVNTATDTPATPGEVLPIGYTFHLDLRVKRKMGERDVMSFYATMLNASNGWNHGSDNEQLTWRWAASFRVLVTEGGPGVPAGG